MYAQAGRQAMYQKKPGCRGAQHEVLFHCELVINRCILQAGRQAGIEHWNSEGKCAARNMHQHEVLLHCELVIN
jgi:hypothetical protein